MAGSPNFDGTPSFGTVEDEVYKGVSDKIAVAAYRFTYTTTVPVAGANTQNPETQVLSNGTFLYNTSVSYQGLWIVNADAATGAVKDSSKNVESR